VNKKAIMIPTWTSVIGRALDRVADWIIDAAEESGRPYVWLSSAVAALTIMLGLLVLCGC